MIRAKVPKKISFEGKRLSVGLDVHAKQWNVSIYLEEVFMKQFQQVPSSRQLSRHIQENYPGAQVVCAYEAGCFGYWIHRELQQLGIECIVVNPADIPTTDKERKVKTDRIDSKKIAFGLSRGVLKGIYVPEKIYESDRQLVRMRSRIVKNLTQAKNQIKSYLRGQGIHIPKEYERSWSKRFMEWLKGLKGLHPSGTIIMEELVSLFESLRSQLLRLNKAIRDLLKEERYESRAKILLAIPGVGLITAMTYLTEIIEEQRFECFDKLNSYIGLCPTEYSSGEQEHKGAITPRAHRLRPLMIEASWIAIRTDPALASCFSDYVKKGMTKKRAIIKIARKLLNRMYTLLKKRQEYQTGIN